MVLRDCGADDDDDDDDDGGDGKPNGLPPRTAGSSSFVNGET